MDAAALARLIDHTLLRPDATGPDIDRLADEGRELGVASVCVNPARVARVTARLRGSAVLTCAVVSFPFGLAGHATTVAESVRAVSDGAAELDIVAPLHRIADRDAAGLERDLRGVLDELAGAAVVKVILETAAWDADQIVNACEAAVGAGADFVKTSTGFHPSGGATVEAVALLSAHAGGKGVKASGGIRDLAAARAMLAAGATRLGCSSSAAILRAAQDRYRTATSATPW